MIEIEEYVRTNNGIIAKVLYFEYEDYGDRGNIIYKVDKEVFDETEGFEEESEYVLPDQIKKHSFNIIDLIEEGDFVNGMEIDEFDDEEGNLFLGIPIYDDCLMDCIEEVRPLNTVEIKSILTKEQYAQNCYKVKEE